MVIILAGIGSQGLAPSAFTAALQSNGQENTASFPNNNPLVNAASADTTTPNAGVTDNPSQNNNTSPSTNAGSGSTNSSSFVSSSSSGADQKYGQSLRPPMATTGTPKPGNPSKNIFFKFQNQDVPGIWMFINPTQLVINHNKKIPEMMTRGGFVLFHWGDALDEISASGITGSFARTNCPIANTNMGYTGQQPADFGLDRRDTWPYLRFMQLLALYRNNGITTASISGGAGSINGGFNNTSNPLASAFSTAASSSPSINKTGTNNSLANTVLSGQVAGARYSRPQFVGIEMHYDDNVFTGFFSSFVWTERAEDPFKFNFDFKFTVLNTVYNKVYAAVQAPIVPTPVNVSSDLLANFQIPSFNSL